MRWPLSLCLLALSSSLAAVAAEPRSADELIRLAEIHSPSLETAIRETFTAKDLAEGTAWRGHLQHFFFALQAPSAPTLLIDGAAQPGPLTPLAGTNLWFSTAEIPGLGALHRFEYRVEGKPFGGKLDLPVFTPDSYQQPGVSAGTLSPKLKHVSRIYDGMESDYWIYVPAQYKPSVPAALMVFQDGSGYIDRNGNNPALNVLDNLIAQGKIPVMIAVFTNPGSIEAHPGTPTYVAAEQHGKRWSRTLKDAMRSIEYDTVSDRYPRFLRDELLPEVEGKYNIRKDSYSRAITGLSSGGICAFNAGWQQPEQFSRVLTWIGSFTAIQWREDPAVPDGGQDYPDKVLREPHRNLRVWMQDGSHDLENQFGSWPMANLRMTNALRQKGYDSHLSFGHGTHSNAHGASEFPAAMTWLWRGYDVAKTEETYKPVEALQPARIDRLLQGQP